MRGTIKLLSSQIQYQSMTCRADEIRDA